MRLPLVSYDVRYVVVLFPLSLAFALPLTACDNRTRATPDGGDGLDASGADAHGEQSDGAAPDGGSPDAGPPDAGPPEPCDDPGDSQEVGCGFCELGTQTRFCTNDRIWEYGPCNGGGTCEPGTIGELPCGRCGVRDARCTETCEWDPTGVCGDEGECEPESSRINSEGCPDEESRVELCSDECVFEPAGECASRAPVDVILLLDVTGSHYDTISDDWDEIFVGIVEPLLALDDVFVGTAYYADFPSDGSDDVPFIGGTVATGTAATLEDEVDRIPDEYVGGDTPESLMEALGILSGRTPHGLAEPFDCPAGRVGGGCYRAGSARVVVVFTDAVSHLGPDPSDPSTLAYPYMSTIPAPDPLSWTDVESSLGLPRAGRIALFGVVPSDGGSSGFADDMLATMLDEVGLPESHLLLYDATTAESWAAIGASIATAIGTLR